MKYIRYFILFAILCLLGGAGFGLISLFSNMFSLSLQISIKSLFYLATVASIPFIVGISKDLKKPQIKIEGIKSDYLNQESKYVIEIEGDWRKRIKDVMNSLGYERQVFIQDYEDNQTIVYVSEQVMDSIDPKRNNKRNSNRIIAEFKMVEEDKKRMVKINIHKEYQYSELSNHDNEMVICKIINNLRDKKEET